MRTAGIVLCGGRSARMGAPKAWLPVGGEPMLARVVRVVGEAVGPVAVVAAPGQDVPPLPTEVMLVRDEREGEGPLGGLAAGLAALAGTADAVYLSACDVPLLKPEFVHRIVSLLGAAPACVPRAGGRLHPLASAYRVDVLPQVRERLAAGHLRLLDLLGAIPTRVIEAAELADIDPQFHSLRNLNTPADYEVCLRELTAHGP